ncbi:MAG: hypothetical protein ACKER6_01390 [Candidatus Hodgkinia cicadicola]
MFERALGIGAALVWVRFISCRSLVFAFASAALCWLAILALAQPHLMCCFGGPLRHSCQKDPRFAQTIFRLLIACWFVKSKLPCDREKDRISKLSPKGATGSDHPNTAPSAFGLLAVQTLQEGVRVEANRAFEHAKKLPNPGVVGLCFGLGALMFDISRSKRTFHRLPHTT